MQAIILAAGYGTRMKHLGKNIPKGLLKINNQPLLNYLIKKIIDTKQISKIYLITNNKFFSAFHHWQQQQKYANLELINDGTNCNEERLGAIRDLNLVITQAKINDDILVAASDALFEFDFSKFIDFFYKKNTDVITTRQQEDINQLHQVGVIQINQHNQVIDFEEKPLEPKSNWECPPIYIYKKTTLPLIKEYLKNNSPDAPGNLVQWLYQRQDIYAFVFTEPRYHIGNPKEYKQINQQKSNEI